MKIVLTVRFSPYDKCFIDHFFDYYLKLGIELFLINFNVKLDEDLDLLNELILEITHKYGKYIKYNIGPNGITSSEQENINMLKNLVNLYTNYFDYVLPTDSDEFHTFNESLSDLIIKMKNENIDYIMGYTRECISEDGYVKNLEDNIHASIFDQFPKYNNNLFCAPKISIIKAEFYNLLGVGHHYINDENIKYKYDSVTYHFRWNLQGKNRIKKWIKIFGDDNYGGWKDKDKYKTMLKIYDKCMLDI